MGIRPKYDWEHVDWTKTDEELEELLGASMSAIYVNRKKYANKKQVRKRKIIDWTVVDWSMSNEQIHDATGILLTTIAASRFKYARGTSSSGSFVPDEWKNVDWSLPSRVIATQMNVAYQMVARYRKLCAPDTLGLPNQGEGRKVHSYSLTLKPEVWDKITRFAKKHDLSRSRWMTVMINKLDEDGNFPKD